MRLATPAGGALRAGHERVPMVVSETDPGPEAPAAAPTPVVGIGASAGGLQPLQELFDHVPPELDSRGAADLEPGPCVFLRVDDDGGSIEPQALSKLFDPFYTTRYAGRGLGLSAALGIARQHGGAIHVQSSRRAGTAFTLLLPVHRAEVRRIGSAARRA